MGSRALSLGRIRPLTHAEEGYYDADKQWKDPQIGKPYLLLP